MRVQVAERDERLRALRPRARPVEPASLAHPVLGHERDSRKRHQEQRQGRSGRAVEQALVLDVDRAGERVVAHQRDDAEVREDVERDEQRAERDRRTDRGQRHPREDAQPRDTEAARSLLERGVEVAERGLGEEEDVGVGGERERRDGAPVAGRVGQALDPERLLQQPALAEEAEQAERGDVARDHERKRRGDRPHAPAGQVGARHEPRGRHGNDDRGDDDPGDEEHRVDDEPQGRAVPEHVERPPAAVGHPDHQVREWQQEERDDCAREERERERWPPAGGRHYDSQPVSRSSSTVDESSAPKAVSSTSGPWISSSGTRPAGGSIPATTGYSFSSASSA